MVDPIESGRMGNLAQRAPRSTGDVLFALLSGQVMSYSMIVFSLETLSTLRIWGQTASERRLFTVLK